MDHSSDPVNSKGLQRQIGLKLIYAVATPYHAATNGEAECCMQTFKKQ